MWSAHSNLHGPAVEHGRAARLRRVAVALDGTPFAEAALPTAVALGRAYHAEVLLVRAHATHAVPGSARLSLRRHERETLTRASLYLARVEQDLLAHGVRAASVSPVGDAADALAAVVTQDCDLVVIAAHVGILGSSQVSVAHDLCVRSATPILLLTPDAQGLFTSLSEAVTFVVALDGERRDEQMLQMVASLARRFAGRVLALCATHDRAWQPDPASQSVPVTPADGEARIAAYLEAVRSTLMRSDVAAWTATVGGDLTTGLIQMPRHQREVLVLASHGTLVRRQAIADRAMTLLRRTGSAVLLVPQEPLLACVPGGDATRVMC